MAFTTRSSVFAFVKEDVEGVLKDPAAADFTAVREGAVLTGAVETTQSDEIKNSIGASKAFVTKEAPTGNIPKYLKTSGIEGTAPDYAILIESSLGGLEVKSTEVATVGGSTAGDATTRAQLLVADGDIATGELKIGQALLIKDSVNNFAVRNIFSLDEAAAPDEVNLNFNLGTAPAAGVDLGLAVFFPPVDSGQPTYSAHSYQASTTESAVHLAEAGTRTTNMTIDFPATDLAAITFDLGAIQFFENPIEITATNKYIDFTDSSGTVAAELEEKVYQTPIHLADEITAKMTGASEASAGDIVVGSWSNSDGKFTISSDGTVLSLLWNTGTNTANSAGTTLGYDTAADDTGSLTYEADNEQTYEAPVIPEFDDADPQIVRDSMLMLGDPDDYLCFGGQNLTISVATPKTDVNNWCATSGVDESLILSRETTVTGTLKFRKHDVDRIYKLLTNKTVGLSFTIGQKIAGNWVPGTITNVYLPEVSITTDQVADNDGYLVEEFEGTAIVGNSGLNDIYITML